MESTLFCIVARPSTGHFRVVTPLPIVLLLSRGSIPVEPGAGVGAVAQGRQFRNRSIDLGASDQSVRKKIVLATPQNGDFIINPERQAGRARPMNFGRQAERNVVKSGRR